MLRKIEAFEIQAPDCKYEGRGVTYPLRGFWREYRFAESEGQSRLWGWFNVIYSEIEWQHCLLYKAGHLESDKKF